MHPIINTHFIFDRRVLALATQSSFEAEYLKNSNNSFEIYDQAMSKYQTNDKIYSDDFAGVYMDDEGYLNIGIVAHSKNKALKNLES